MLMLDDIKIFLFTPPTDMRKSIDTLCMMVSETLQMDPANGHLFIFRNKTGNKIKALYYELNCFSLWYRRLEKGKFIFPRNAEGAIEVTQEHFRWLLASDKFSRLDAMKPNEYTHFC